MIERLRDRQVFGDPDEAEAARLLGTVGPSVPSPAFEQRVLARLRSPGPRDRRLVRVVIVAGVGLAGASVLAATLVRAWPRPRFAASGAAPLSAQVGTKSTPGRPAAAVPPATAVESAAVTPREFAAATEQAPSPSPRRAAPVVPKRRTADTAARPLVEMPPREPKAEAPASEARAAMAPPEEAALVLAAVRALRREHDPAKASDLLARYLTRFPQGVLAEEAFALDIEAARSRGDDGAARARADDYLRRFPMGRFAHLARRATDANRP